MNSLFQLRNWGLLKVATLAITGYSYDPIGVLTSTNTRPLSGTGLLVLSRGQDFIF
ncbi:MAG: hypothetical protein Q7U51_11000 [Methanoregula sp.]|nr:hypothetical protein [Methanoregula sp.]